MSKKIAATLDGDPLTAVDAAAALETDFEYQRSLRHANFFDHDVDPDHPDFDRTIQSHAEDVDINVIMKRHAVTGTAPGARRIPEYGDFSQVNDYQEALNQLVIAQEAFLDLPADVREEFANDPGRLYAFLHDPKNLERARELGLVDPEAPPPPPQKVEVVNPPSPPPEGDSKGK